MTRVARTFKLFDGIPPTAIFGLAVIALYLVCALAAPALAPHTEQQVLGAPNLPWSGQFLLGTDSLGRDVLSRMIYAARNTLGIAITTTILAFMIGGLLGLLAATLGGWVTGRTTAADVSRSLDTAVRLLLR